MNKTKVITLTDEMQDKIAELKKELGYPSESMVIYSGITMLYQKTFPPHTQAQRGTPEQAVQRKKKEAEARTAIEHEKWVDIAKQLKGEISQKDGGVEIVKYFTYAGRKRYEQETPLHLMTVELVASQYSPDKKTVLGLQKDKKVDY